jgi:hypothetical protein
MSAPPVAEEPCVPLVKWGVIMAPDGEMHLAGLRADREAKGRTSTPLRWLDCSTMEAGTASGRRYLLQGPPDDDTAFQVTVISWGYVNAACTYPITAEEAQLRLAEPPTQFVQ